MSRRTLTRAPDPHAAPPVSAATRRDLFGTMGAMLLLTAAEAGPAKAVELDGELLALCDKAVALHAASDAVLETLLNAVQDGTRTAVVRGDDWDDVYTQSSTWQEVCARIADIPARTPEGLVGKATVLRRVVALEEPLVASLCRDLLGRVGA